MTCRTMALRAAALAAIVTTLIAIGGSIPAQAQLANVERFEGILTAEWGDPTRETRGAAGGVTRFHLTDRNGTTYQLDVPADQQSEITHFYNKRVVVQGRRAAPSANAAGTAPHIAVDNVESAAPNSAAPSDSPLAATVGTRKVLYILLRYKGDAQTPHPVAFYTQLTNPLTPPAGSKTPMTINGFYKATSWGKLKWAGAVAGNKWFTLPKTKAQYAPCMNFGSSCTNANLALLRNDALALVNAAHINWQVYDNINFVVNNDLDCCAWGGSFVFNNKVYGATYEPPWAQEASTYVHEFGHSLGLPHSGWRYEAYDSPWDEMSDGSYASYIICGTYKSANGGNQMRNIYCYEPGAGYITPYKEVLGWLPAKNRVVVNAKGTKVVTLSADALPLGNTKKMIKVCVHGWPCTGSKAHFYSVELKLRVGKPEMGIPNQGVIIHNVQMNRGAIGGKCFFNNQSGWAVPIDATPGDYNSTTCSYAAGKALQNAQFTAGKIFKDVARGIKITIGAKTGNTYRVTVVRSK